MYCYNRRHSRLEGDGGGGDKWGGGAVHPHSRYVSNFTHISTAATGQPYDGN